MKNIGIIGQGFVGTAVREKFRKTHTVLAYDKFSEDNSSTYTLDAELGAKNTLTELIQHCSVIFTCVPTPMFEDGECDTSIVESVVNEIAELCGDTQSVTLILKSTVPPGTTAKLNEISDKVLITFSPEFLTEANSIEDFDKQDRIVLGIDYMEAVEPVRNTFTEAFPDAKIIVLNSREAEMSKYMTNLFLATKVSFFNDMYSVCDKLGINYTDTIEAVMHDPRIGKSHYMVPGPDGDRGYGGHCFPKDMEAIMFIADENQIRVPTLMGASLTNRLVRTNKDWEEMEGRAVSKREADLELANGVIGLEQPDFYYNINNPTEITYDEDNIDPNEYWASVESQLFNNGELLREPKENEIIYRYTPDRGYILRLELAVDTAVDQKFED